MKHTRKVLIALLVVLTLLMSLTVVSFAADEATETRTVYFTNNKAWTSVYAYYWGGSSNVGWPGTAMTKHSTNDMGEDIYMIDIPIDTQNIIFHNNSGSQTVDIALNESVNAYYLDSDQSGKWTVGTWSFNPDGCTHTPDGDPTASVPATCTEDGSNTYTCSKCGESYTEIVLATGHKYDASSYLCSGCNRQAVFVVAGDAGLCGNAWDIGSSANTMTYANGVYTKVFENIAAGTYQFKCAQDYSWNVAFPSENYLLTVAEDGSTVTVTLTGTTVAVDVQAPHTHTWSDATCKDPQKCECGATNGTTTDDHNYSEGKCTVCGADDPDYVAPANDKLINFSTWALFDRETYADGDTYKYNDIFTFIYSKNSRVDENSKTFDDGLSFTQRFSFGGKTPTGEVPAKNALQITVDGAHTVKVWFVAGGDGRYCAILDSEGNIISSTPDTIKKNELHIYELSIPAAGTYYLGVPADNNYIFQIELVPHNHTEEIVAAVPATCTETGLTEGKKCSVCNAVLVAQEEIPAAGHNFVDGKCTVCTADDPDYVAPVVDYYLVGYINGANYGCEGDYENMGEYKFVDGKLTAKFTADSYVMIKTGDNSKWYMTNGCPGDDATSATLYITTTEGLQYDKLKVPANVNVEFTLTENVDGTLTLSYTEIEPPHVNTLVVGDTNKIVIDSTNSFNNGADYYTTMVSFEVTEKAHYEFTSTTVLALVYNSQNVLVSDYTGKADLDVGTYTVYIAALTTLTYGEFNVAVTKSEIVTPDVPVHENKLIVGEQNKIVITDKLSNANGYYIVWVPFVAAEDAHYKFVGENLAIYIFNSDLTQTISMTGEADLVAGTYNICIADSTAPATAGEYTVTIEKTEIAGPVVPPHQNTVVLGDNHYIISDTLLATGYEFLLLQITEPGYYTVTGGAPMTLFVFHDPYIGEEFDSTAPYSWNVSGTSYLDSFTVYLREAGYYWVGFRYDNVGDLREFDINIAAHEHSYTDATCTAPKTCPVCGYTDGDALGHTEVVDAAVAPTCTTAGKTEGKHCSVCNETLVAQKDVPATGHSFADGTCSACGEADPDFVAPEPPAEELGFFEMILKAITDFFAKIGSFFAGIFGKIGGLFGGK